MKAGRRSCAVLIQHAGTNLAEPHRAYNLSSLAGFFGLQGLKNCHSSTEEMMIKILTRRDQSSNPAIFDAMYAGRAAIFGERLGWEVSVVDGLEIDEYDRNHDPVYIVSQATDGTVTGSLRLLPTTGDTMLAREFRDFFDPVIDIKSPTIWECTRLCVHQSERASPGFGPAVELLHALCSLALHCGITHIAGVYEASMTGVYRRIGWSPKQLAVSRPAFGRLIVGTWTVSERVKQDLSHRADKTQTDLSAMAGVFDTALQRSASEVIRL